MTTIEWRGGMAGQRLTTNNTQRTSDGDVDDSRPQLTGMTQPKQRRLGTSSA